MNSLIHPMINQLEFHPFYQQKNQKCVLKQCDCLLEAWGPLNEGQRDIFHHPMLLDIAEKTSKISFTNYSKMASRKSHYSHS